MISTIDILITHFSPYQSVESTNVPYPYVWAFALLLVQFMYLLPFYDLFTTFFWRMWSMLFRVRFTVVGFINVDDADVINCTIITNAISSKAIATKVQCTQDSIIAEILIFLWYHPLALWCCWKKKQKQNL